MLIGFCIMTLLFLVLPVAIKRKFRFESTFSVMLLPYFLLLGTGYILIQAVSIQRLTLFLGQPAYAFQVILFSMLVFSGTGSFVTGRFSNEKKMVTMALVGLLMVAVIYTFALSPLIHALMPHSIPSKIVLSILLLSPLYFFMGMPFPLGLRMISRYAEKDVVWMYAVNGGGSVIGSIIGMILAFSFGFSHAFLAGVLIYGGAFLVVQLGLRM
jgi:MFS family permease